MATHDFNDGRGPVNAHQHARGGGWVEDGLSVSAECYIGPHAEVFGAASITGLCYIMGHARIFGAAQIIGDAQRGPFIGGTAQVYETAIVRDQAFVYGDAIVRGSAVVDGHHRVGDGMEITSAALLDWALWGSGRPLAVRCLCREQGQSEGALALSLPVFDGDTSPCPFT